MIDSALLCDRSGQLGSTQQQSRQSVTRTETSLQVNAAFTAMPRQLPDLVLDDPPAEPHCLPIPLTARMDQTSAGQPADHAQDNLPISNQRLINLGLDLLSKIARQALRDITVYPFQAPFPIHMARAIGRFRRAIVMIPRFKPWLGWQEFAALSPQPRSCCTL